MKKKNIFIIVIILIVAGVVLIFLNNRNEAVIDVIPGETPDIIIPSEKLENDLMAERKIVDSIVLLQGQLENRARFFIERYNTYSSDSNQENLRSLLPQVSDKFDGEINVRLREGVDQTDYFFSYQTKVLSLNLLDFTNNEKAIFSGQIQEQETEGEITKINYKMATLEFIYQNGEWKVDVVEIN